MICHNTASVLFLFVVFGYEVWGILIPQPRIETAPPALEEDVLTAEPSRNSLNLKLLSDSDKGKLEDKKCVPDFIDAETEA